MHVSVVDLSTETCFLSIWENDTVNQLFSDWSSLRADHIHLSDECVCCVCYIAAWSAAANTWWRFQVDPTVKHKMFCQRSVKIFS